MRLTKQQRTTLLAMAVDYARADTKAEGRSTGHELIIFVEGLNQPAGFAADRRWLEARQERDTYARSACDMLRIGSIDRATAYAQQSARWQDTMTAIQTRYQDQQQRGKA